MLFWTQCALAVTILLFSSMPAATPLSISAKPATTEGRAARMTVRNSLKWSRRPSLGRNLPEAALRQVEGGRPIAASPGKLCQFYRTRNHLKGQGEGLFAVRAAGR